MAGNKGLFRRIVDAMTGAVNTAGLAGGPGSETAEPAPEAKPGPKSARKAAQKASIARAEETQQKATDAVRAARRRRG